jgi:hypothetical protein
VKRGLLVGPLGAIVGGVLLVAVAQGESSRSSESTYEVTFAGRNLSIPVNYFPAAPSHSDQDGVQGLFIRFLWPSLEGKTAENASAFNTPTMPINGMHMQHVRGRTEQQMIAASWFAYTNDYQPSSQDTSYGDFRLADDAPDRNGYPLDIYYRLDSDNEPSEFIVCDPVSATGQPYPNPGCQYFFAEDGIRYQTNFRLHLLNEASEMKTAWLAKMHEFEVAR